MGNFSKNPDTVLQDALAKGYNRVLFQQGKPVLDRELNLLADLVSPQRLMEYHIGNGVPDGSDGFRISNLNVAQNDFSISAGRCLVGGYEVKLETGTTYKTQPHAEHVAPLPAGTSYVYLHVFTSEVNGTQDSGLNNPSSPVNPDVGFETAVRKKVEWEVIVKTSGVTTQDHMLLAVLTKTPPNAMDRRRTGLTVASMRDEITTARGSQASLDARLDVSLNENGTLANGATVTGDLFVNGKLGIGTTNPLTSLHIRKDASGALGPSLTLMNGAGSAGAGASIDFDGYDPGTNAPTARIQSSDNGNYSSHLLFLTKDSGAANKPLVERMRITDQGKVGVGTTQPNGTLDVRGDIRAGNSDIYFTKTDHNHSGIGNALGFAAIENAANYGALMILGRTTGTQADLKRTVKLWDYLQVNGTLEVTGELNCSRWKVTRVLSQAAGPLPGTGLNGAFTSAGGTLLIFAYGSGWSSAAGRVIGMQINVDNMMIGVAKVFTNEASSHKSFVGTPIVVTSIGAGNHTLGLYRMNLDTQTDGNDFFDVTVLELPFR